MFLWSIILSATQIANELVNRNHIFRPQIFEDNTQIGIDFFSVFIPNGPSKMCGFGMDNTIYWLLVAPASSIQPSCRLDSPSPQQQWLWR